MSHYLWSARFITGALTLLLGVALGVGGALYLTWSAEEATYELALGAGLCLVGPVLALKPRAGLAAYCALLFAALAWVLLQVGLDIWMLVPRLAAPLIWGGVLLALRHRIAPTRLSRIWPSSTRLTHGHSL